MAGPACISLAMAKSRSGLGVVLAAALGIGHPIRFLPGRRLNRLLRLCRINLASGGRTATHDYR